MTDVKANAGVVHEAEQATTAAAESRDCFDGISCARDVFIYSIQRRNANNYNVENDRDRRVD